MANSAAYVLPDLRRLGAFDPVRTALFLGRARGWYGPACVHDKPDGWTP